MEGFKSKQIKLSEFEVMQTLGTGKKQKSTSFNKNNKKRFIR